MAGSAAVILSPSKKQLELEDGYIYTHYIHMYAYMYICIYICNHIYIYMSLCKKKGQLGATKMIKPLQGAAAHSFNPFLLDAGQSGMQP